MWVRQWRGWEKNSWILPRILRSCCSQGLLRSHFQDPPFSVPFSYNIEYDPGNVPPLPSSLITIKLLNYCFTVCRILCQRLWHGENILIKYHLHERNIIAPLFKIDVRAGETAQELSALSPQLRMGWLTAAYNSAPRDPMPSSGLPRHLHTSDVSSHRYIHINRN